MTQIVLNWQIAYSGTGPRGIGWDLADGGWPAFIENYVRPALKWAEGLKVAILLHHPWGQIGDPMYLDGYDQAKAEGVKHLTNNFATAKSWKQITAEVPCWGYVGGLDLTPRLRSQSVGARCVLTARNLKPFVDAGFRGVFVDYAENAIERDFVGVNAAQSNKRSVDVLTLAIADAMFPQQTGIEATPRAFETFRPLWRRRCVLQESTYQHRYGPNRHSNWQALGYDRSILPGSLWRTLPYSDDVATTAALARKISSEGDTPCVSPQPFIREGVSAIEVIGAK